MPRPPPPKLALMMIGKSDVLRGRSDVVEIGDSVLGPRHDRHARVSSHDLRRDLVAERIELLRCGTDEGHAGCVAGARKLSVFGEKAVTRMNGVDAVPASDLDDGGDVQIGSNRLSAFGRADQKRFIRLEPMQRKPILEAVDGDSLQTQLGCRAETADGDFRSVGDEQLLHSKRSTIAAAPPNDVAGAPCEALQRPAVPEASAPAPAGFVDSARSGDAPRPLRTMPRTRM